MAECVGIVGVGLMGRAFSHHLLQAGFKVQGFDLDERRLAQLHEGAHDLYVDVHGPLAVKHAGKHRDALFRKGVRQVAAAAPL